LEIPIEQRDYGLFTVVYRIAGAIVTNQVDGVEKILLILRIIFNKEAREF
jgi:hypothetical protein